MTNRRAFLGGILSLGVAAMLPVPSLASLPTIYADGEHDDYAGLQALLDGRAFHVENEGIIADGGEIANGVFRISRGLTITHKHDFYMHDCIFHCLPGFRSPHVLYFDYIEGLSMDHIRLNFLDLRDRDAFDALFNLPGEGLYKLSSN